MLTDLLTVKGLSKRFCLPKASIWNHQQCKTVVSNVSFKLAQGRTLGVVGESGCGKTTLARMLVGLEEPDQGQIFLRGKEISTLRNAEKMQFYRQVQYIFQDPYSSLPPRMTIGALLEDTLATHHIGDHSSRLTRSKEMIRLVGLSSEDLKRFPHQFSGGQRQRISIARALILEPSLVLCDEPVSALDVSIQAQILNLFVELQERLKVALLFISHDLRVIHYISEEIMVMYMGHIVEIGPSQAIFTQPSHPYTQALLNSIPGNRPSYQNANLRVLRGEVTSTQETAGCPFFQRCALRQTLRKDEQNRCKAEKPVLQAIGQPGHYVACHYYLP